MSEINDKVFKSTPHFCPDYDQVITPGASLTPGYKPDAVLQKGNRFIILEREASTNRKGFLGGLLKAAYFLQREKSGFLIYIMKEWKNTKAESIALQLLPYAEWLHDKSNLEKIYIIDEKHYYHSDGILELMSKAFENAAYVITRSSDGSYVLNRPI